MSTLPVLYRLQLLSYTHRFPHYFVTNSRRSGAGHVTTLIYILQGSRAYRSGTGLQLPSYTHTQISSLFCHQFPPVQCCSCDNSNIHTTGFQSLPVWYWATVTLINTQISSLFCHQFPPVRYWLCDNACTGPQLVRYRLQLPIYIFPLILSPSAISPVLVMLDKTNIHQVP